MQTFLPYTEFHKTAKVLDYRRLGKQRIETKQILRVLLDETQSKGWRNHPAVLMWKGYEGVLAEYGFEMSTEWLKRGFVDNQLEYFRERMSCTRTTIPKWLGDEKFHLAHRSNLVRKDEKYYRVYFPNVPNDLPYIWPSSKGVHT